MAEVLFDMSLRQNGSLQVNLTPLQGRQWRGVERRRLIRSLAQVVEGASFNRVVVKDERGVVVVLPVGRNAYSKQLPRQIAINLIELDATPALVEAWSYMSASAKIRDAMRRFHEEEGAVAYLRSGAPTAVEVERMIEGEPMPFDCPVCGCAAETTIERSEEDGSLEVITTCERGHEIRKPAT